MINTEVVTAIESGTEWIGLVKVGGRIVWTVTRGSKEEAINAATERQPRLLMTTQAPRKAQAPRPKPPVTKQPVTIRLDIRVVDTFKHLAAKDDRGYQGMINKVLRDYVDALPDEDKYHDR